MTPSISREKLIELFNDELNRQGFKDKIPMSFAVLGVEFRANNEPGKIETTVFYRQTTRTVNVMDFS